MQFEESSENHRLIDATLGGRYSVDRLIHQGRRNDLFMGQEGLDETARAIVLKVPHRLTNESAMMVAREAGFLTNIDHPNVVRSFDVGSDDHNAFLVLEPIVGETLAEIMERNGPMAEPEVLEIFWQILSGTRAMHDAGIVHRDLRPRNVCLERREGHPPLVKLIDFASARFLRPGHPDAEGEPPYPVGAHRYMAPEQHRGEETGPWVDLFAIGMMLHAALVGELAEPGERLLDKRAVSVELDEVVALALAPEPADRFPSSLAFQDALTRAILVGS